MAGVLTHFHRLFSTATFRGPPYRVLTEIMAIQTTITKLASPVKDLVLALTQHGSPSQLTGRCDKDEAEVSHWIEQISQGAVVKEDNLQVRCFTTYRSRRQTRLYVHLQDLDTQLVPRTFLIGNYFTAADVALYGALYPVIVRDTSPIQRMTIDGNIIHILPSHVISIISNLSKQLEKPQKI